MKIVRVIPLYKGDNNQLIHSYRHISVLPFFSRIFENIVFKNVLRFLDDNNILYEYHFGFRTHQAFDTADHCILLNKQEKYGIRASYSIGLKGICLSGNNLLCTTIAILIFFKLHMECPNDPYSGPFSSFYILMTFLNHLIYYLQMTHVCSLRELYIAVS